MKIVAPACGKGERFRAAGYEAAKPLIAVHGKPMIDRVVSALNLCEKTDEHIVVINIDGAHLNHPIVRLDRATVGAAETA